MHENGFTEENWEDYAHVYDTLASLTPYRILMNEATQAIPFSRSMRILDAACGTGNVTQAIVRRSTQLSRTVSVAGVDRSRAMINIAAAKSLNGATFAVCDLDAPLPFARHTFDAIICINGLYAVSDPEWTLCEFRRMLAPRGTIVVVTPKRGYENGLILRAHAKSEKPEHYWTGAHVSPERERALLREAIPNDPELRAAMEMIAAHNRTIAKTACFHFFDEHELRSLIHRAGLAIRSYALAYAGQCHLTTLACRDHFNRNVQK